MEFLPAWPTWPAPQLDQPALQPRWLAIRADSLVPQPRLEELERAARLRLELSQRRGRPLRSVEA